MIETEFDNDIVFARYLKYMMKALKHKRASYINKEIKQNKVEVTVSDSKWNYVAETIVDYDIASIFEELSFDIKSNDISELNNALKTLSSKQNAVIDYYYFKKLSNKEIASKMNISENAVEKLKIRAIKRLKEYFTNRTNQKMEKQL